MSGLVQSVECRVVAGHKLPDTGCRRLRRPMEQTAQTLRGADAGWSLAVATPALVPGIFNGRRAGAQGAGWGDGGMPAAAAADVC